MSISLKKGEKVSLTKGNTGLVHLTVGLGWDEVTRKGSLFSKPKPIDCDASAFLLKGGKFKHKEDIVYFGNLRHHSSSITHMGDNLTGAGDGDDEQIKVNLGMIPADYDRVVFVVNIYDGLGRKQHFGMIANAFIRIVDDATGQELLKYNLSNEYADMTGITCGELYRHDGEWKFNAIGQGAAVKDLGEMLQRFT